MEEAPKNGKESPHSVHANGLIDLGTTLLSLSKRSPLDNSSPYTANILLHISDVSTRYDYKNGLHLAVLQGRNSKGTCQYKIK